MRTRKLMIAVALLYSPPLPFAGGLLAHQSPRTTKLYDRTKDEISLDEVERIKF